MMQKHTSCQRKDCMNQRQLLGQQNHSPSKRIQSSLRGSVLLLLWLLASCADAPNSPTTKPMTPIVTPLPIVTLTPSMVVSGTVHHYEYVFPDGGMDVYDIDHNFALVQ